VARFRVKETYSYGVESDHETHHIAVQEVKVVSISGIESVVMKILGWMGREMEKYSLEHVKGIGNESQRANGVPCLCKVDISRQ